MPNLQNLIFFNFKDLNYYFRYPEFFGEFGPFESYSKAIDALDFMYRKHG